MPSMKLACSLLKIMRKLFLHFFLEFWMSRFRNSFKNTEWVARATLDFFLILDARPIRVYKCSKQDKGWIISIYGCVKLKRYSSYVVGWRLEWWWYIKKYILMSYDNCLFQANINIYTGQFLFGQNLIFGVVHEISICIYNIIHPIYIRKMHTNVSIINDMCIRVSMFRIEP